MITYRVGMRWPLWYHGDIGTVIRQSLQFILAGEGQPIQCYDDHFTFTTDAPTSRLRDAVEYVNNCVKAAFPTLVKECGLPCGDIEEESSKGDARGS